MKRIVASLALFLIFVVNCTAQIKQLSGTLIDAGTRKAVSGASVFIPNVGSATTASNGQFVINTSGCKVCVLGDRTGINIYHPDYGYDLQEYTFDKTYIIPTLYIDKRNAVQLLGRVFNKATNDLLGGIKVTCQLNVAGFYSIMAANLMENMTLQKMKLPSFLLQIHFKAGGKCPIFALNNNEIS
jgi:hypothetical protein